MPDWKHFVAKRVERLPMPRRAKEDIVAELAVHLEETYEHARSNGLTQRMAVRVALQEVENWHALTADIRSSRSEGSMNHRTKTLWLPGIAILFSVGLMLLFLDRAAMLQRLIWIASMGMLLGAAASETDRLNQRTKSLWLPGFISLNAAAILILAIDVLYDPTRLFREITLHPHDLLRTNSGSRSLYLGWLVAQVAFGALGALYSRRAGGTRTARIVAGAFPAVVIVGTYVALMPFTSMFSGKAASESLPAFLVSAIVVWVVAPAITVSLGAAPFLRASSDRQVSQVG